MEERQHWSRRDLSWKNLLKLNDFDCSSSVIFNFSSCPLPSLTKCIRDIPDVSHTPPFLQCAKERNFLRLDALYHFSEVNFKIIAEEAAFNQLTGSFKEINEGKILGRSKSLLTTKLSPFYPNLPLEKQYPSRIQNKISSFWVFATPEASYDYKAQFP